MRGYIIGALQRTRTLGGSKCWMLLGIDPTHQKVLEMFEGLLIWFASISANTRNKSPLPGGFFGLRAAELTIFFPKLLTTSPFPEIALPKVAANAPPPLIS